MTHEFKTPIATMGIAAGVFMQSEEIRANPRLLQYAHILKEQNKRLNQQIERVLQVARFERNQFELKKEPVSLHALIREVYHPESLLFEAAGGSIRLCLDATYDRVVVDPLHTGNVLHSLLDNALKYHAGIPDAEVRTYTENMAIVLEVTDKGIGIAPEYQTRVFDKFYRVPTGNVHNVKGFGLGLYYVKRICEAHGWKLRLKSLPGHGTTFSIKIQHIPA
jgi:two-component system phosphate regulon sensor histidine kinase PhoR